MLFRSERGWLYGGESSGHLLCLDHHSTGDATISALQVLAAVQRTGRSLAELAEGLEMMPQTLINVRIERGFNWQAHAPLARMRTEVEHELADQGRILIRASGTEPLVRVMVEAPTSEECERIAGVIAEAAGRACGLAEGGH